MRIKKPFFLILSLVLTVLVLIMTQRFILLIMSCFFLSYMIKPLYSIVKEVVKNASLSALISESIFFTALILIVLFILNSLLSQIITISSPILAQNLISIGDTQVLSLNLSSIDFENPLTKETIFAAGRAVQEAAFKTPLVIIDAFLIIYITYFFIKGSNGLYKNIVKMVPGSSRQSFINFINKANELTKEIIYGYFLTAIFIALLTFILLKILAVKYSVDYALLSGLASLIPVVGNWLVPSILAVYYFINDNLLLSVIFLVFAFMTSYLVNIFRTIIRKGRNNIHPLVFITGVIVGFFSLGFIGFLIGPILFGIVQSGFEEIFKNDSFRNA